jgi:hypothetical protein
MLKFLLSILVLVTSLPAQAVVLSTSSDATVGGHSFHSRDIFSYDPTTGQVALLWAGAFVDTENVDAVGLLPGGRMLVSTSTDAQLVTGLAFRDGDLVLLDPVNGVGSLWFSEDRFGTDEDIDAVELLPSGHLLLSTSSDARLGGLPFHSGDVIEYDPVAGSATLLFSASVFADTENIDAIGLLGGDLILSTSTDATIGSTLYRDGDLFRYSLATGAHSLFLSESIFGGADEDIDAVSFAVPEPGILLLLLTGLLGISFGRTRSKIVGFFSVSPKTFFCSV